LPASTLQLQSSRQPVAPHHCTPTPSGCGGASTITACRSGQRLFLFTLMQRLPCWPFVLPRLGTSARHRTRLSHAFCPLRLITAEVAEVAQSGREVGSARFGLRDTANATSNSACYWLPAGHSASPSCLSQDARRPPRIASALFPTGKMGLEMTPAAHPQFPTRGSHQGCGLDATPKDRPGFASRAARGYHYALPSDSCLTRPYLHAVVWSAALVGSF
jgi:hypothetical protein